MKTARISGLCQTSLAALVITGALASPALSGAFTQQAGKGQIIATATITDSNRYFDAKGNVVKGPAFAKREVPVLIEYGVTDWLTAMVTPAYQNSSTQGTSFSGLEYAQFGGRVRLMSTPNSAFAIQAWTQQAAPHDKTVPVQVGLTDVQNDVRALYGLSFDMGGWPSFIDLQAGYRLRNGAPPDEWHYDATFGFRPDPKVLVLAQSFNVVSNGAGYGVFPKMNYSKLQLTAVYDLSKQWSVQAGGITTIAGESQIIEPGVVAGLWYRF